MEFAAAVGDVRGFRGREGIPLFALAGQIGPAKRPGFFFDMADPEKRTREDLVGICRLLGRAAQEGQTILLGLNYKELQQVATVLSLTCPSGDSPESIRDLAARIQHTTGITEVIIHPCHRAAVATRAGVWSMEGPFTPHPKLSTGAGDHFNAGYCHARLQDLSPELALAVGTATSGFYVRNGKSPSNGELEAFIDRWVRGELPE